MLKDNILEAINRQINREFYSAYLYLAMSAASEERGLRGIAKWFRVQHEEELTHAYKLIDYVHERGGVLSFGAIEQPQMHFDTPLEMFESAYEHECFISQSIFKLADLALEEKDHPTTVFLQWFITEQVEEEASIKEIIDQLRLIEGDKNGLLLIDRELNGRSPLKQSA